MVIMKHVSVRSDKRTYYKAFIWKFHKSVFDYIYNSSNCNVITKAWIVAIVTKRLQTILQCKEIQPDWSQFDPIDQQICNEYNNFTKPLTKQQKQELDVKEQYWIDWGSREVNYEKWNDTFTHIIPIEKQYDDITDLIADVNNSFEQIINEK